MASWRSPRTGVAPWRLGLVVALFAAGMAMMEASRDASRQSATQLLSGHSQHFIGADLNYRLGDVLDLVARRLGLEIADRADEFRERALASYERQALTQGGNPDALRRLGLIYGERGYAEHAREALGQGALIDAANAPVYLALADLYDPARHNRPRTLKPPSALAQQERWLADMALVAWATQEGDPKQLKEFRARQDRHTLVLAVVLAALTALYGLLAATGLVRGVIAIGRWAFTLPVRNAFTPAPGGPWRALEALEVAALTFFVMAVLGLVAGLVHDLPAVQKATPLVRVLLAAGQYLLLAVAAAVTIWQYLRGSLRDRLMLLGFRAHAPLSLMCTGMIGYGGLLCLFGLATIFGLDALATAQDFSTGDPLRTMLHNPPALISLYLFVCGLVPVVEETIFRGFVYAGLRQVFPVVLASLGSAVLFALMHYHTGSLVVIGLLGIVLANLYERTQSLVPPIVCHALHNLLVLTLFVILR